MRMVLLCFWCLLLQSCRAQSDAIDVYYRSFGKGQPIVIINGGPGMNSEGFAGLATLLSENHRVILFDQRGTGHSVLPEINASTITMDAMVADMEKLREKLQLKDWIVMGHSFGGMLASYYTTKHPDRVKALILSSSGGIDLDLLQYVSAAIRNRLTKQEQDSLDYWNERIANGDTSYNARIARGRALAPAYLEKKEFVPQVAERLTQGNMRINNLVFDNMRKMGFNCAAGLSQYKGPVLVVQGKQDIIRAATAMKVKTILPAARIELIDQCAHYGWLEQKEKYTGIVLGFLSEHNL